MQLTHPGFAPKAQPKPPDSPHLHGNNWRPKPGRLATRKSCRRSRAGPSAVRRCSRNCSRYDRYDSWSREIRVVLLSRKACLRAAARCMLKAGMSAISAALLSLCSVRDAAMVAMIPPLPRLLGNIVSCVSVILPIAPEAANIT